MGAILSWPQYVNDLAQVVTKPLPETMLTPMNAGNNLNTYKLIKI